MNKKDIGFNGLTKREESFKKKQSKCITTVTSSAALPGGLRQADVTVETELGQTLSAWAAEESWDVTKTAPIAPGI